MYAQEIIDATVRLTEGGQGVLVEGNVILTAAHCINGSTENAGIPNGGLIVEVETTKGKLLTTLIAIEQICDIAALGPPGNQVGPKECLAYREFCEATKQVEICPDEYELFETIPITIRSHRSTWINGVAHQDQPHANRLVVVVNGQVERGTSGGPILNQYFELVGLVSFFSDNGDECDGLAPRPHLALPNWLVREMSHEDGL